MPIDSTSSKPQSAWPPATADGAFATTQWTAIIEAARDGDSESSRALNKLCETYWTPVYAFIRGRGNSPEDAKDLTQGFFAHLLEKRQFEGADKAKGKFRTYLLGAVKFYLSDERKRSSAQRRGGGSIQFSIDAEGVEAALGELLADDVTPDTLFDRQWIRSVLDAVSGALKGEYGRRGKADLFDELKQFLIGGRQERTYVEIAEANGISESAVKMAVKRMRERFGVLLRQRIAETVGSDDAVEEEVRSLLGVFS